MHIWARTIALAASLLAASAASAASATANIGVNVLLDSAPTSAILADLGRFGRVRDVVEEIRAVTMQTTADRLPDIRALPHVVSAGPDAERKGGPIDTVTATDFAGGINTWDLDAVNVTDFGGGRVVPFDGAGVYVAVLDTGLLDSWRQYFPEQRIATQFAVAFGGGGGEVGSVSTQPNKWEHDQHSHGTHVTSTILGYSLRGAPVNGVAPLATVVPVKVLNQNGSGWSSVVARGIVHVADLKASGAFGGSPVVINMSLGGPVLDAMEKAAIDYAISQGVLVVASAGNEGTAGMGFPGAYAPVISVAASGWVGEWAPPGNRGWWNNRNVADPTNPDDFYITDFSSRQLAGQDLDVAAPGSWVVGPFQLQSGKTSYFFLGGTSMASPHVAGIVALMAQKFPALGQVQAEQILTGTAIALPRGCRTVAQPAGPPAEFCWDGDATGAGLVTADAALAATP
ncbi:MAG TPA: S8 family serine peptidase [Anaeromyxobacter sp.]|nr:S8 family serine peptidase [Anaeromyxobacter sp.]